MLYYLGATLFLGWYVLSGRNAVRFRWVRLRWAPFCEILRVGALAAVSSVQTNLTVAVTTALVERWFGEAEVAGYATGARLEYLLMPLVLGIGTTLVAMVGMNIGAGQWRRAMRIALTGTVASCAMTEALGLAAALWPEAWLRLFGTDPAMLEAGASYLRIVGPFFGCYGFGFALYFAAQRAGRLAWPLLAGFLRLLIAAGGCWAALRLTGSAPIAARRHSLETWT